MLLYLLLCPPSTSYMLKLWISDIGLVGLVSSIMEVEGLKRSVEKIQKDLNVVELVTDDSTSVQKLMGKLMLPVIVCTLHIMLQPTLSTLKKTTIRG